MAQAISTSVIREVDSPTKMEPVKIRDQSIFDALFSNHSGDADAPYGQAGMIQHYPADGILKLHDGTNLLDMLTPAAAGPASDTAVGAKGQFWLHSGGIDICVATNTWMRFAGAAFSTVGV